MKIAFLTAFPTGYQGGILRHVLYRMLAGTPSPQAHAVCRQEPDQVGQVLASLDAMPVTSSAAETRLMSESGLGSRWADDSNVDHSYTPAHILVVSYQIHGFDSVETTDRSKEFPCKLLFYTCRWCETQPGTHSVVAGACVGGVHLVASDIHVRMLSADTLAMVPLEMGRRKGPRKDVVDGCTRNEGVGVASSSERRSGLPVD
ncbi:hypothetical protein IAQ61_003802 [Plenodomus lingam]|uniref:uncharacterized protein n=1 Tax=Leptosphaeria maculans TaxID=5022 RepID=UPI00331FCD5C|nr:hypothetical protein IAQ61_003802 [Plenodomus lingam]